MPFKRTTLIVFLLAVSIVLSLISVTNHDFSNTADNDATPTSANINKEKFFGVWINYAEFADLINGKSEENYKEQTLSVLKQIKGWGFNTVVLHLRSHCDAFYKSEIFPFSSLLTEIPPFDPLGIFLDNAHSVGISVHGWINPYRVAKAGVNIEELSQNSAVNSLYKSGDAVVLDSGTYLLPSSITVQKLIIDGVEELINNYPLDGIHLDDYFYPTTNVSFDEEAYNDYVKHSRQTPLDLGSFRRNSVNALIFGLRQRIKGINSNIVFGISPCADIEKNYNTLYADVSYWIDNDLIDYICPQIYFGFEYPKKEFRFDFLLNRWEELCNNKVKMTVGLGAYKSGESDAQSNEWIDNNNILSRQANAVFERNLYGVCIYNYSSLAKAVQEREKLSDFINHIQ